MRVLGWVGVALALTGCRRLPSDAKWLRRDQLGDPARARVTAVMSGNRLSETDWLPRGQQSSTVQDELTLTHFGDDEICVAMLVRTPAAIDRAVPDWQISLNGRLLTGRQKMNLTEGSVSERDFPTIEQAKVFAGWGPHGRFGLTMPRKGVFTVVERNAVLCVPRADVTGDAVWVEVDVGGDQPGSGMSHTFGWKIVEDDPPLH